MKHNQPATRRPSATKARLSCALVLTLWLGGLTGLPAQSVPDQLNYQGILLDGQGHPVAVPTDVEFRIYNTPTAATGLQWGRALKITPDTNGAFNVVLSEEGSLLSGAPDTSLASVFNGAGSDARYLELTVAGSTPISPRQRFVASPYAFLANGLTAAALQNFTVNNTLAVAGAANVGSLTAVGNANVGSLTTAGSLTAAGAADIGSLTVNGAATVGSMTVAGAANVNSTMTASNFVGYGTIPVGGIIMWSGPTDQIPQGWALCDGSTNYGHVTPDLRDRFIVGSGGGYTNGATGGLNSVVLTTSQVPLRPHYHSYDDRFDSDFDNIPGARTYSFGATDQEYGGDGVNRKVMTFNTTTNSILTVDAHENRPPYYALAFIMRVK